ncbi:MAG: PaaI family thioesterase [Nevskia sp.]|nr:PaaI family thioesterase [Nevskia sp.]
MNLEEARRRVREQRDGSALLEVVPYAAYLGLRIESVDSSAPVLKLPFRPSLIGNSSLPALHGGVVAAFAETAAMLHLLLVLDEQRVPKSVDFSIDYLRSAHAEDSYASCSVERLGRRVAQVQVRCWQSDPARPVAVARAHFLLAAPDGEAAPADA